MDTMSYIIGRNSAGGGGTGSTPSWSDVTNKPFSTVGEGLEVSNGALKEAVPIYYETSEQQEQTEIQSYPERDYTATATNEFIGHEAYAYEQITTNYNNSCKLEFNYWANDVQIGTDVFTVQDIFNNGTEVFTDNAGLRWHFYFTNDEHYHLTCIDSYDGLDLRVRIYAPDEADLYYGSPERVENKTYYNSFSGEPEYGSDIAIATDNILTWTWFEGEGYSQNSYPLTVNNWDATDKTAVYTDPWEVMSWHLYLEQDENLAWIFHAEALGTLPAGTSTGALFHVEFTRTAEVRTYHQLPAQYIPVDDYSITVADGKLHTYAVRSIGYSDYTGQTGQLIGELNVNGEVVYGIYAPAGSGSIPAAPETAGTYTLQVVVDASGNPTYSWVPQT